jgi:hypothetical protein
MNGAFAFEKTFMISAEKGHGVDDLRAWLAEAVPEGPWLYPEDQIADLPLRMIAAEMTREKLTLRLHQELPYQLTVETENWEERKDGSARIDQVIYVARDGHKGIVLGNKGETIKAVSKAAREEIEPFSAAACTCSCRSRCAQLAGGGGAVFRDGPRFPRRELSHGAADRRVLGAGLSRAAAAGRYPRLRRGARRCDGGGRAGEAGDARRAGHRASAQLRSDDRRTRVDGAGRGGGGPRWTRRFPVRGTSTPTSG